MTRSSEWAVEAHGLVKTFGDNRAVDGVDLTVRAGAVYGVLGPNGAGKTTTISMLATLLKPDAGEAFIFGHDIRKEQQVVRQLIGVTAQFASVDETLSANENLMIFSRLLGLSGSEAKRKTAELLEEFGLTEAAKRPLKKFSGGMRRRLDLAASLIAQPPLIFLDEPTTGLDPRTRAQMWDTIRRLVATGSTVLLTTQYLDEADQLADEIVVIDHGLVIATGTSDQLKARTGAQTVTVRPASEDDRDAIAAVLGGIASGAVDLRGPVISAPVTDPAALTNLVRRLDEKGLLVAELALRSPSLDEVFLTLTGHTAGESASLEGSVP